MKLYENMWPQNKYMHIIRPDYIFVDYINSSFINLLELSQLLEKFSIQSH